MQGILKNIIKTIPRVLAHVCFKGRRIDILEKIANKIVGSADVTYEQPFKLGDP